MPGDSDDFVGHEDDFAAAKKCVNLRGRSEAKYMSSKFFNNSGENTLFAKLKGIAQGMANFDRFLAVAGFFRSSGYFKLRKELDNVSEIKILVGINVDEIFKTHNQALLMLTDESKAKDVYSAQFWEDILNARYDHDVEEGILQMCDDLTSGRLQMKIHGSKNLHAKFYLCLPQHHDENTDGWVIMGSSNMSDSGLGTSEPPRYELNVAMKDYDDVAFCKGEFDTLWSESIPQLFEAILALFVELRIPTFMCIGSLGKKQDVCINRCALKHFHTTKINHQLRVCLRGQECPELLTIPCSHPLVRSNVA